jgi:hypothetical protein
VRSLVVLTHLDLDLRHVDAADDPLRADALRDAGPAPVNQPHDVAAFCCGLQKKNIFFKKSSLKINHPIFNGYFFIS